MNDTTSPESNRETSAGPFAALGQKPNVTTEPHPQASDVGTLLCTTRMRLGKDLLDIVAVLHIRYNFLVAIEDGRYEDLPGQAYAMGFVRAYAEYLGLDGDVVVRRFKEETAGVKRVTRLEYPISAPESGMPSGALLMIAVVLGMMVYGVWYSMADADRHASDVIQEVPDRLAAILNGDSTAQPEPEVMDQKVADAAVSPDSSAEFVPNAAEDDEAPPAAPAVEISSAQSAVASLLPAPQIAGLSQPNAQPALPQPTPSSLNAPTVTPSVVQPAVVPPVGQLPSKAAEKTPENIINSPVPMTTTTPSAPPARSEKTATAVVAATTTAPAAATPAPKPSSVSPAQQTATAPSANPASPTPVPSGVKPVALTAAATKPAPQVASAPKSTVELRAKSDSRIQIRDGEQLLLTRFLRKGETYKVPERAGLTLMTLNAGGIEIMVDGQLMPPLGDLGSVARGILLDAAKLKAMPKPAAATAAPAESNN